MACLLCGRIGSLDTHGEDGVTARGTLVPFCRCCRSRSVCPPQEVVHDLSWDEQEEALRVEVKGRRTGGRQEMEEKGESRKEEEGGGREQGRGRGGG